MAFSFPRVFRKVWLGGLVLAIIGGSGSAQAALDAVYQWSVQVPGVISSETGRPPQAFLWIPPDCLRLRAVVVGQHNMEEELILEHPLFRQEMARLSVAVIWITPAFDPYFRFDRGAGEHFQNLMEALAQESGYRELAYVPVIPIGHSAMASYPWMFAAWNPSRTVAAISVSGQWPFWKDKNLPEIAPEALDGVPGLVTIGEYEWAQDRAAEGLKQRVEHPRLPLSMLAAAGEGHFDVSDEKVAYLALYIRKALEYRLPAPVPDDGPVTLRPIDPQRQGWLAERWHKDRLPTVPPAPVDRYQGDPAQAFWYFDQELALATAQFRQDQRGKKPQLVGYIQDGQLVPQIPGTHHQVALRFLPLDDGLTFRLEGAFLDQVPAGRPERWTGLPAGSPIDHARAGGPVRLSRICGPVIQTGPGEFSVRFDRVGTDNKKRSTEIWLLAEHPGDQEFKRAVQQALMRIPLAHNEGVDQHIDFDPIPDQLEGTEFVPLHARSDAGLPVYFYVLAGPAQIEGDRLRLLPVPPRAAWPVKVTVVAWQWGRSVEPKVKTAQPVVRTFQIHRCGF